MGNLEGAMDLYRRQLDPRSGDCEGAPEFGADRAAVELDGFRMTI